MLRSVCGDNQRAVDDQHRVAASTAMIRPCLLAGCSGEFRDHGSKTIHARTGIGEGAGSVTRTILLMVLVLIAGGGAAIYVWSSLNLLLKGQASLFQGVITVLAIVGIIGLILLLQRLSLRYEDERDDES